ncbi:MAG: ankyrin repeat domain-containing protein [Elusimicrobiota bacterium]|jgi:ankyrin repeat protein|nr:ankyrin repeat domain-containing protein [Elusimicrobiota bacterium]
MAAAYGNIEIIKILLANGADIHNENKEGLSTKAIAYKMGHQNAAELLE